MEAMAAGTPVIAYKNGGSRDFVIDGKTGTFFNEQSVNSLKNVLLRFDESKFETKLIITNANKFSENVFRQKIGLVVDKLLSPPPATKNSRR